MSILSYLFTNYYEFLNVNLIFFIKLHFVDLANVLLIRMDSQNNQDKTAEPLSKPIRRVSDRTALFVSFSCILLIPNVFLSILIPSLMSCIS